jgi:hypothetical protein
MNHHFFLICLQYSNERPQFEQALEIPHDTEISDGTECDDSFEHPSSVYGIARGVHKNHSGASRMSHVHDRTRFSCYICYEIQSCWYVVLSEIIQAVQPVLVVRILQLGVFTRVASASLIGQPDVVALISQHKS